MQEADEILQQKVGLGRFRLGPCYATVSSTIICRNARQEAAVSYYVTSIMATTLQWTIVLFFILVRLGLCRLFHNTIKVITVKEH